MLFTNTNEFLSLINLITEKIYTGYGHFNSLEVKHLKTSSNWSIKVFTDVSQRYMLDLLLNNDSASTGTTEGKYTIYKIYDNKDDEIINSGNIVFKTTFDYSKLRSLLISKTGESKIHQFTYYVDDKGITEIQNEEELAKKYIDAAKAARKK